MQEVKVCPECGAGCVREEVDVGIGIQYGPWHCTECPWSQEGDYLKMTEDAVIDIDPMEAAIRAKALEVSFMKNRYYEVIARLLHRRLAIMKAIDTIVELMPVVMITQVMMQESTPEKLKYYSTLAKLLSFAHNEKLRTLREINPNAEPGGLM